MEHEKWLTWLNLNNEAYVLKNNSDITREKFVTKSYSIQDDSIVINSIFVNALVRAGEILGVYDIHKKIYCKIKPLSDNVALVDNNISSVVSGIMLNLRFPGYIQYVWFPEGIEATQSNDNVKYFPEHNLVHLKWLRHNLFIFRVRVPDERASLHTFYPENYSKFAFNEHPKHWFGYWQYDTEPAILYNFSTNTKLYSWKNKPVPFPEDFIQFLAKRMAKTFGGSYKSFFIQKAV